MRCSRGTTIQALTKMDGSKSRYSFGRHPELPEHLAPSLPITNEQVRTSLASRSVWKSPSKLGSVTSPISICPFHSVDSSQRAGVSRQTKLYSFTSTTSTCMWGKTDGRLQTLKRSFDTKRQPIFAPGAFSAAVPRRGILFNLTFGLLRHSPSSNAA